MQTRLQRRQPPEAACRAPERKKQGITQTELARLVGCPQPSIVRIETRKLSPTISMLQKICDVLGLDITAIKKEKINKHLVVYLANHLASNVCIY